VAEAGDDLGQQLEPVSALVRDQDAEVRDLFAGRRLKGRQENTSLAWTEPLRPLVRA
jgi:hypothetical protein